MTRNLVCYAGYFPFVKGSLGDVRNLPIVKWGFVATFTPFLLKIHLILPEIPQT